MDAFSAVCVKVVEVVEIVLIVFVDVKVIWEVIVAIGILVWVTVFSSDAMPESVDVGWKVIHFVITLVAGDGRIVISTVRVVVFWMVEDKESFKAVEGLSFWVDVPSALSRDSCLLIGGVSTAVVLVIVI